jgi:hypothetical protein
MERPTFDELFAGCSNSAVHLEMRDMYAEQEGEIWYELARGR